MKNCGICEFKQDINKMKRCICCGHYHCDNCLIACDLCGNLTCKDCIKLKMFTCETCNKNVCFCCVSPIIPDDDFRKVIKTECKICKPVNIDYIKFKKDITEMVYYAYKSGEVLNDFTWFQHYNGHNLKEFHAVFEELLTQGMLTKVYDLYCTSCGNKHNYLSEGFNSYVECINSDFNSFCDYCNCYTGKPDIKFKYKKVRSFK